MLITPYSIRLARDDPRKCLFNLCHSGLRTECTENIFGRWKKRWSFLKSVHVHYGNAVNSILATAVLHNLGILWNDEHDEYFEGGDDDDISNQIWVVDVEQDRLAIRAECEIVRNRLMDNMPPATRHEQIKMNRFQ